MDTVTVGEFLALACAAVLVGFAKTAVGGAGTVALAVFAAVLPARESTGVLLPLLLTADLIAVRAYRGHTHWPTLLRLFPAVVAGVVAGTLFLAHADDRAVRTSIGTILLLMLAVTLAGRRSRAAPPGGAAETPAASPGVPAATGRVRTGAYGLLGGFTTMVANAGGPVLSLYLLSARFRALGFLATSAWFFLVVNAAKVPFSVGLGLIDRQSLLLDAALVGFVLPGAALGRRCAGRIDQRLFERLVLAATALGALHLLAPVG
ncbi:sulfite exporter TauE/SafE family protein [Streptomyces sp. NPDC000594]|uniref:sulfite exporter TauE/SafE family protein n=1 Tax=Streptomyces sp. NPDC000594 TaxID=3154261 RepID=UPI00332BC2A7